MPKLKLPEQLRAKIKALHQQGYEREEVFMAVAGVGPRQGIEMVREDLWNAPEMGSITAFLTTK